jgi:hypothetical protein
MEYDQNNMYKFFSYFSVNFASLYVRNIQVQMIHSQMEWRSYIVSGGCGCTHTEVIKQW